MWRLALLVALAGCTSHNPGSDQDLSIDQTDLSVAADLSLPVMLNDLAGIDSKTGDLAVADLSVLPDLQEAADLRPVVISAHSIVAGDVANGGAVKVAGLVLTGVPRVEGTTTTDNCIYGAFAQDPSGVAPCALRLFVIADPCIPTDMSNCRCPQPPATGTLFDVTDTLGDVLTITGTVDIFTPPGLAPQHSVRLSTLDKIGTGGVITPLDITDPTPFAKNGAGYATHENMMVTIHPSLSFTISTLDNRGNFTGAGAQFSGIYRFYYTAPAGGSTFSSITGVAQIAFGGVAPRVASDFVP